MSQNARCCILIAMASLWAAPAHATSDACGETWDLRAEIVVPADGQELPTDADVWMRWEPDRTKACRPISVELRLLKDDAIVWTQTHGGQPGMVRLDLPALDPDSAYVLMAKHGRGSWDRSSEESLRSFSFTTRDSTANLDEVGIDVRSTRTSNGGEPWIAVTPERRPDAESFWAFVLDDTGEWAHYGLGPDIEWPGTTLEPRTEACGHIETISINGVRTAQGAEKCVEFPHSGCSTGGLGATWLGLGLAGLVVSGRRRRMSPLPS